MHLILTPMTTIKSFIKQLREAKRSQEEVFILTHIDADGLSAGAIIAKTLHMLGIPFLIKPLNQIRRDVLEEMNDKYDPRKVIVLDMGSGDLKMLEESLSSAKNIIVIDHHIPTFEDTAQKTLMINPWIWGYNGSVDISTSGLSLLTILPLFKKIEKLETTIQNAITGALGDSQDVGDKDSLIGLNKEIVELGKKRGIVKEEIDLKIHRRSSKPLYQALASMYLPKIPGITGNEESALKLLEEIGITENRENITLDDLEPSQKNALTDILVSRLVFAYSDKYTAEEIRAKLITTNYIFPRDIRGPTRSGREFAILLNACGKLGKPEIGLGVAIGDRKDIYRKSVELYNSYQKVLSENLNKAMESIEMIQNLYVVDARDWLNENLTSSISSLISWSKKIKEEGVIVVIGSSTNDYVKVSLRLTERLRGKINLKQVVKEIVSDIKNASGGGHDVAAGAYVPKEKVDEFLKKLASKVSS